MSELKFLVITNLTHFFMCLFISYLYMFRASQRSSSGDRIVFIHHLVWLVCVSNCLVCRSGGNQILVHTGCFMICGHYCRRWFPRSLWSKMFIEIYVRFWMVTELWTYFNSRIRPRVNRVLRNQLASDVLDLVAYRLRKLQRAPRAVINRAAGCVAAGGGIFENQL